MSWHMTGPNPGSIAVSPISIILLALIQELPFVKYEPPAISSILDSKAAFKTLTAAFHDFSFTKKHLSEPRWIHTRSQSLRHRVLWTQFHSIFTSQCYAGRLTVLLDDSWRWWCLYLRRPSIWLGTGSFGACTIGLQVELSESAFSGLPSRLALMGLSSPKRTHVLSRRREAYAIGLSAIGHLTRTGYLQ